MGAFEIYTYGGAEYLRMIFNGIAAIMGAGDYVAALKVASVLGVIAVVLRMMLNVRPQEMSWILAILVLIYGAFVPRANVMIIDRLDPSMNSVVANVPIGVAATAGLASHFGDWVTRAFETVFTLPNDLKYSANGTLFGARLVEASARFDVTDMRVAANLSEFWANCVYYDIVLGRYTWDDLTWSTNLWTFLQSRTSQVRRFPYVPSAGPPSNLVCREAIAPGGRLDRDLQWVIGRANTFYARRLFAGLTPAQALAKFATSMPNAYAYLTNLSLSSAEILRQNIVANSLSRGLINFATQSNATAAAVDYATARAEAERRNTYQAVGEMALRTLPLLRNIFEALIYAIFPVVLLIGLIAPKQATVGYLKSVFWIQLWAPLYAVLHLGVMLYARGEATAAVLIPTGAPGLAIGNLPTLEKSLADMGYIAGYLSMSIPLIAYMVVQSGGALMGSLAATITSGVQMAAARGAEEATTGNISMGNSSFDNVNWFKNNRAPVDNVHGATVTQPDGTVSTFTATGDVFNAYPHHQNMGASVDANTAVQSSYSRQAGESMRTLQSEVAGYSQSVAAEYSGMSSYLSHAARQSGVSQDWSNAEQGSFAREAGEVRQITQTFAKEHQITESQASQLLAAASLSVQQPELFKLVNPVNLRGQLDLRGMSADQFQEAWKDAQQTAAQTRYGEQVREASEAARREGLTEQIQAQHARSDTEQGGYSDRQVSLEDVRASFERARYWQEVNSYVEQHGVQLGADLMPMVRESMIGSPKGDGTTWSEGEVNNLIVRANAGDPEATRTLLGRIQEIATDPEFVRDLGITPTPTDAGAVHKQWRANRDEIDGRREEVEAKAQENRGWVRAFGETNPSGQNLDPERVRAEIQARGGEIRERNEAARGQADRSLDKSRNQVDGQVAASRDEVQEKTDHPGVLDRAVSLDPLDYGAGKIKKWMEDKFGGDKSDDDSEERPARSGGNRGSGRH